jgi:hypothetical protein
LVAAADAVDNVSFQSKSNKPQENLGKFFVIKELRASRLKVLRSHFDLFVRSFAIFTMARAYKPDRENQNFFKKSQWDFVTFRLLRIAKKITPVYMPV